MLWLSAGCTTPTQLIVVVDSDYEIGPEIDALHVSVSSADRQAEHRFDLVETGLPLSFGVVPSGAPEEEITLNVIAEFGGGGEPGEAVAYQRVVTSFVPGRRLQLEVPLSRHCPAGDDVGGCPSSERCLYGACVPEGVDPSTLPDATDTLPDLFEGRVPPDASVPDGGVGADGGAPPGDAGQLFCSPGETCTDGTPCMMGMCSPAGVCENIMSCADLGMTCSESGRCERTM